MAQRRRPTYAAVIQKRGGEQITEVPWSALSWGRALDDMTPGSATVPVSRPNHRLASVLADLNAWEHELAVHWGDEEVWVGPVTEPAWSNEGIDVPARDLFQWFERRRLPITRVFSGPNARDLGLVFKTYALDALLLDPSPNIDVVVAPTGVIGDRNVFASQRRRAADAMRELARDAVDFTMDRRRLLAGGAEVPTPQLPTLTTEMCIKPKAQGAGLFTASSVDVIGATPSGAQDPIVGTAGGVGVETGLVERAWNESSIPDVRSANAAAQTRHDALAVMPLYLTTKLVLRRCPPLSQLVAGARWPVDVVAGVKHVEGMMRLSKVSVNVSTGPSGSEDVEVTLIPLGTIEGD